MSKQSKVRCDLCLIQSNSLSSPTSYFAMSKQSKRPEKATPSNIFRKCNAPPVSLLNFSLLIDRDAERPLKSGHPWQVTETLKDLYRVTSLDQ
ncbi:hypothetical protein RRG08_036929 [Elysia crispata]|uniref:Uncharacterized protein n=1 Tax=Elysia crispata TaxID=231223 RepID=A0AAE0ZI72_9GAST|nr:hypothetical protein RRG08_036929 [Elysia crispata]